MSNKVTDYLLATLLTLMIILGVIIFVSINFNKPTYYKVTTFNLDKSKNIEITREVITQEFSGTYSYQTLDNRYVRVPIKNTIVEELNAKNNRNISPTP